jgi:hypothetical protein
MTIQPIVKLNLPEDLETKNPNQFSYYRRLMAYYPETNNLKYNDNVIFQFNSFLDMQYFFTIMIGCDFAQYSENRLPGFSSDTLWAQRRSIFGKDSSFRIRFIPGTETEMDWTYSYNDTPPIVFNSSWGPVDLFFSDFTEDIVKDLLNPLKFGYQADPGEIVTPESMHKHLIKQFILYLRKYRVLTVTNLPTLEFWVYMRNRTVYQDECFSGFYEKHIEMMSIDLMIFFSYKEDIIDLIECFRLTGENFKSKGILAFNENLLGAHESYPSRSKPETIEILRKLLDYYLPPLLENLSYQASLLPTIIDKKL